MSIDLERFHQTFFEESFEGLQAMEAALLGLDPTTPDDEDINTIFRAAHSIKGGAGTFGFTAIAEFTHILETLLDQVRSHERAASQELIDLVLRSVDVLRDMLEASRDGGEVSSAGDVYDALQALLEAGTEGVAPESAVTAVEEPASDASWVIDFKPNDDMMLCGNDPLRILKELSRLGEAEVVLNDQALPAFAELEPEKCFLSWRIELRTDATEAEIQDVFAWVEDDCELSVSRRADNAVEKAVVAEVPESGEKVAELAQQATAQASEPAAKAEQKKRVPAKDSGSVRVAVEKIDALINLVGELVITQSMLEQTARSLDPVINEKLLSGLGELDRNTRHLQEAVMSTRMLPVDFVFSRFPRVVRDTSTRLGKKVKLELSGEGAELDKSLIEKITDPLNHIVRNSIDHGIEEPHERSAAGKNETATIRLSAWHQGGYIAIQVSDDGRGLNREKILQKAKDSGMNVSDSMPDSEVWQLIFAPGLSTAAEVTDISGRGVGMDVVRKNIQSLGGNVDIESEQSVGTKVTIRLPLTLAILDGMSVRVGEEIYILPLSSVIESLQPTAEEVKSMAGESCLIQVRGEFLRLLSVRDFFGLGVSPLSLEESIVVIIEAEGRQVALVVDELVGQQQVVIKSLEQNYRRVSGISGATIMGDGRVALIVDVGDLVRANHLSSAA